MLLSTSAVSVFAQSALVATLSHEGEITAFYGASALQQAHEAATHGDVITLSSGTFNATYITKAITLRGAGMELDSINNIAPTILLNDFHIIIPNNISENLKMEGIYHNGRIDVRGTLVNAQFTKCRFNQILNYGADDGHLSNCSFVHCKIMNRLQLTSHGSYCELTNCYACVCIDNANHSSSMRMTNCVLKHAAGYWSGMYTLTFVNSVIIGKKDYRDGVPSTKFNCVEVNMGNNPKYQYDDIFKDFTGTYTDATTFELTDEAKATFLGTDGTQVGIYGGRMPYSPITTNPRITKCDVAAKSTADGKLSIDLEVSGAE